MARYPALKNFYFVEKTIGSGGFAKVKLATHLLTGEKVAIKVMTKSCLGDDLPRVKLELTALKSLSHHHISKLYQVIETPTHFFLVMEYCSGGELFDHIVEKRKLSEMESRSFFRQILSAVAYLHSCGYAHRDLKPENVLLDKDQTLKLIDFGLCAKPTGGLQVQLLTSCGSPTYAAPELIRGHKYLGPEVDVWSMGVLLYALLCGFLPFDADNIDSLYKKILSGKYEEPPWLSEGSKRLLRLMLQTDKKKRITVLELLSHPWIQLGYNEPVNYQPLYKLDGREDACVKLMADHYRMTCDEMWKKLSKWDHDYFTATYLILLIRKKQGLPMKLLRFPQARMRLLEPAADLENRDNNKERIRGRRDQQRVLNASPQVSVANDRIIPNVKESCSENDNLEDKKEVEVVTPTRKVRKRPHSPGPNEAISPVPAKIPVPVGFKSNANRSQNKVKKGYNCGKSPATPRNLSSPGYKILGSIEKSLSKVRNVLTPTKHRNPSNTSSFQQEKPIMLTAKNLCNVSATSYSCPEFVLNKLKKALDCKGIVCKSKGFTLRGKLVEDKPGERQCKLSFELEVCLMPSPTTSIPNSVPMVVVRRKRLKGDAWCYKKVCEEVLGLTVNNS